MEETYDVRVEYRDVEGTYASADCKVGKEDLAVFLAALSTPAPFPFITLKERDGWFVFATADLTAVYANLPRE